MEGRPQPSERTEPPATTETIAAVEGACHKSARIPSLEDVAGLMFCSVGSSADEDAADGGKREERKRRETEGKLRRSTRRSEIFKVVLPEIRICSMICRDM